MIAPARRAAYDVLVAIERQRVDLPEALARARERLGDDRDRALLVELATGTLRWQAAIDHVLAGASSRPLARLDLEVLTALRLGAYQLLHLSRVPASAVVDDSVSLVRAARKTSAAGFVNALLRTINRRRPTTGLPPRPEAPRVGDEASLQYLSVSLSHPRWIAERWLERAGFERAETWLAFDNRPAPLTLRAVAPRATREDLTARLATSGVQTRPARFAPDALIVEDGHPFSLAWAGDGSFVAQDEASQLVGLLGGVQPGERILDACAAPGGKTLIMAAQAGDAGLVVAADVRERRVHLLSRTLARAGVGRVAVVHADAAGPLPFGPLFDAVLVDAPCSGLGVLRREPDIRWRRGPGDLPRLAGVQLDILRHAGAVVRPGGRLVYSTCSTEPEENEAVVEAFLREAQQFREADAELVRAALPPAARHLVSDDGQFRTVPWRDDLEGFFGAVLLRV